jgi:phenylalanyl-tRNA synthetase beta chain
MKLSEKWLREWVNPAAGVQDIADKLVMGGLELEVEPLLKTLPTNVVVGRIVSIAPHPNAERLRVCEVDVGQGSARTIVCGAANARAGMLAPCALPGAKLPNGMEIKIGTLRGVESAGMLCSAAELGLAEKSEGLLELDADAKAGMPIEQHLLLDDTVLNLELTPNRGDCLSVQGLAREVSALFGVQLTRAQRLKPAVVVGTSRFAVEVESASDCPNYAGRVIDGLNPKARTPDWMRERLRRSGIRSIHPLVDVTNYVMLELGQPLHAFDAAKLKGNVQVRRGRGGERLTLLSEQVIELGPKELVIADASGPIALAGVMGGLASGVTTETTRIFLESACFSMQAVAGTARRHKVSSDAAYRFERGVDPELQRVAIDRATELITRLCGGEPGPITHVGRTQAEPVNVPLRHARLKQLLGHDIPAREVEALLTRLGITLRAEIGGSWTARVPSYRHDLRIEADLIEEVARLYGYDRIPAQPYAAYVPPSGPRESQRELARAKELLAARGWQEVTNLAFVDPRVQTLLMPDVEGIAIDNPIAENLAAMRTSLWSGLLQSWLHNHARQVGRVRLFETGVCFLRAPSGIVETPRIAGLMAGAVRPEQWGERARDADFYDLKDELEALLGSDRSAYLFEAASHPALHPGQSARLMHDGKPAGWIGALHPQIVRTLGLPQAPLVFETEWQQISRSQVPRAAPLSEFPQSRRDLAVVVSDTVSAQQLCDAARAAAPDTLREAFVFDLYREESLGKARKSLALALIFQDRSRTLTVEEVDAAVATVSAHLKEKLAAELRR